MSVAVPNVGPITVGPLEDWSGRVITSMPAGSIEFLRFPIADPRAPGATPFVRAAVTDRWGTPTAQDWQPVRWQDGWARLLTTGQLADGKYALWAELTAHPQRIVRRIGLFTVTPGPGDQGPVPLPPGLIGVHIGTYIGSPTDPQPAGPGYLPAHISDLIGSP